MRFGEVVQQARKKKGMTQVGMAASLGVSQNSVSGWECGEHVPSVPVLAALANLLDLDPGEMLTLAAAEPQTIEATA